jgi:hypothetical protein
MYMDKRRGALGGLGFRVQGLKRGRDRRREVLLGCSVQEPNLSSRASCRCARGMATSRVSSGVGQC